MLKTGIEMRFFFLFFFFFLQTLTCILSILNQYEPSSVCVERSNGTQTEIFCLISVRRAEYRQSGSRILSVFFFWLLNFGALDRGNAEKAKEEEKKKKRLENVTCRLARGTGPSDSPPPPPPS